MLLFESKSRFLQDPAHIGSDVRRVCGADPAGGVFDPPVAVLITFFHSSQSLTIPTEGMPVELLHSFCRIVDDDLIEYGCIQHVSDEHERSLCRYGIKPSVSQCRMYHFLV